MIKLIFCLAALLPYVESRLLGISFNTAFHPGAEEEEIVDAQNLNEDFHMDPAPPVTVQLTCNYGDCNEVRRLGAEWNQDFHPSQDLCPQTIDLGQGNRHLGISFNDDYHPLPSGILCLVPTPEPEE